MSTNTSFAIIDQTLASPFRETPMARFLKDKGVRAVGNALPAGYPSKKPKHCFMNAYQSTFRHDLDYYEGWAWADEGTPYPFAHAWCVDRNTGLIVDQTWRKPEDAIYLGVKISRWDLLKITAETEVYGVLNCAHGFAFDIAERYFGWRDPANLEEAA